MRFLLCALLITALSPLNCLGREAVVKPDFSLPSVSGETVALKDLQAKHKAVAVIFVATQCPFSNAYNERMNQLDAKLKAIGVALVGVNSNDTEDFAAVKAHALEKKFSFPVLKDDKHTIADAYRAERTPEAFLITRNGTVAYHGRIDDDSEGTEAKRNEDLFQAAAAVAAGKPVKVAKTKSFGCSIKRKG